MNPAASILDHIRTLLRESSIPHREIVHAPTPTSEDSARARGEPLSVGAKALLLRTGDTFRLFVIPADRRLDSAAVKQHFGVKKLRFATAEELSSLTGLVPGAVPPFGEPVLPFPMVADPEVGREHGRIAFNAGSLTHSVIMATADWERLARPVRIPCATAPRSPEDPGNSVDR